MELSFNCRRSLFILEQGGEPVSLSCWSYNLSANSLIHEWLRCLLWFHFAFLFVVVA